MVVLPAGLTIGPRVAAALWYEAATIRLHAQE